VLATRTSKSKPGLGFVTIKSEMLNQRGETVLEMENTGMFLTREAAV
jgi:acyl dehydratase